MVRCLRLYLEKVSALSSLFDSRRKLGGAHADELTVNVDEKLRTVGG